MYWEKALAIIAASLSTGTRFFPLPPSLGGATSTVLNLFAGLIKLLITFTV